MREAISLDFRKTKNECNVAIILLPCTENKASIRFPTVAKQMIATLKKSEGSLWHTQGLHFDGLGAETIIYH